MTISNRKALNMDQIEQNPLVSVIMPAYNAETTIEAAVQSVCNQTYKNLEIIIVNDCSTDQTMKCLKKLASQDNRICYYTNTNNMGAAESRNRGIVFSKGEYIAFIDSDDYWHSEKIVKQIAQLLKHNAAICCTAYSIIDSATEKTLKEYHIPEQIDYISLLKENVIGCSTVMMEAKLLKKHLFQTEYYHEDYVLWLRCLKDGVKVIGLDEILVEWCYSTQSKSGNKIKSAVKRWEIYRHAEHFSLGKSLYYFCFYFVHGIKKYFHILMK